MQGAAVCVIIGGGISGLSAHHYLSRAGIGSTVVEARGRLGGVILTERAHNCVVEAGPDSFLAAKPWAMELIADLGLTADVIGSNDHRRRTFIWKGGQMVPFPDGLQFMVPTRILPVLTTPLLSWRAKLRMGLEWFDGGNRHEGDRSVAQFVEEHYGREVVDYVVEPLLSGIYGGDPRALSAQSVLPRFVELEQKYGSLTKGTLKKRPAQTSPASPLFRTLKGGMGQLVDTLARNVTAIHERAHTIERREHGFRIRLDTAWTEAASVVIACEAYHAGALVRSMDARLADLLTSIPYTPSIVVALGFERAALNHPLNGFGFLTPKTERRKLIACTWVGTKFNYRVPESMALLRCFLGGVDGDPLLRESDGTLVADVLEELREKMEIQAAPVFSRVYRWPASMAQYTVGHQKRWNEIQGRLAQIPGLHLAGNGYVGIGIPDCIRTGKQAAEAVAAGRVG